MDVGIFLVSGGRLKAWLIIPPMLMASVGLGSYAWQQRAEWQLQKTKALSEVLPAFITARKEAAVLVDGFQNVAGEGVESEDQLISFLQDMAYQNDFMVNDVSVVDRKKHLQQQAVPVLHAVVRGTGGFMATELYINTVKSEQRLLSVNSIKVMQPNEDAENGVYDVEIIFELLLLDDMATFNGGSR